MNIPAEAQADEIGDEREEAREAGRKRKEQGNVVGKGSVGKENASPPRSEKEAAASPAKKKQRGELSPVPQEPAQANGASQEPGASPGLEGSADAAWKLASPAASPAASAALGPSGRSSGLAASLPDWVDRPLCFKQGLEEDEEVHRFNYIAGLPLGALASEGKTALVEAVLRGGGCDADLLNQRDNNGNTALHLAVAHGRTAIAGMLLEAGAQHGIKNNKGLTALDLANEGQFPQIVAQLHDANGL